MRESFSVSHTMGATFSLYGAAKVTQFTSAIAGAAAQGRRALGTLASGRLKVGFGGKLSPLLLDRALARAQSSLPYGTVLSNVLTKISQYFSVKKSSVVRGTVSLSKDNLFLV